MRTLIVGPAIGELGWMLMGYNPYCRAKSRRYEHIVVCCHDKERYIWEDFATEFWDVNKPNRADRWRIKNGRPIKIPKALIAKYPKADRVIPCKDTCTSGHREYKILGGDERFPGLEHDREKRIIIHARATTKYHQQYRNWSISNFKKIVELFPEYEFVSVGTQASHIPGTIDRRNISLKELCDLIASSALMIGPSSGPMHLSSLCGTQHVVWSSKKRDKAIRANNRKRYEKLWNPFSTKVHFIDDHAWQPPYRAVSHAMKKVLA